MSLTKADETFQESVQALANWLVFLEEKKAAYARQLERAISVQSTSVETIPPIAPEHPNNGHDPAEKQPVGKVEASAPADTLLDAWDVPGAAEIPADVHLETWDTLDEAEIPMDVRLEAWDTPDNAEEASQSPAEPALSESGILEAGTPAVNKAAALEEFPDWLVTPSDDLVPSSAEILPDATVEIIPDNSATDVLPDDGQGAARTLDNGTADMDNGLDPWL